MKDLIYLAAPYTSSDRETILVRVDLINKAAAHLFKIGHFVFSPISHTHPIKECSELDGNFEFWKEYDCRMLGYCNRLVILTLDGWLTSKGVKYEIEYWRRINSDHEEYMDPISYLIYPTPNTHPT